MRSLVSVTLLTLLTVFFTEKGNSMFLEYPCGRAPILKINGGEDANAKYATWMAAIFNSTIFQCGGTIIHRRFVLTAGHCLLTESPLYVRLGARNISNPSAMYTVENTMVHPDYNKWTVRGDIGLLQLSKSITYNFQVQPICIIADTSIKRQVENLHTFRAFGWGNKNGRLSEILQTIDLVRYERKVCQNALSTILDSTHICAGRTEGDTCGGDSGGPLSTSFGNSSMEVEVQLGIVSGGTTQCKGPGVYTDVTSYVEWIRLTIATYDIPQKYNGREETFMSNHFAQLPNTVHPPPIPVPPPPQRIHRLIYPNVPETSTPQSLPPMLYNDCSQNISTPIAQLSIYGPRFTSPGVFITDQLIITAATDLPEVAASLYVVFEEPASSAVFQIESVSKHPNFTNDYQNDIAALKIVGSISSMPYKPICILTTAQYQLKAELYSSFNILNKTSAVKFGVNPMKHDLCSRYMGFKIHESQFCVEDPSNTSELEENQHDILAGEMYANGQKGYLLFGIFSFSSEGILVFTNVMRHTNWIRSLL
ncbi:prostasin [Drosophila teissieri]|uniref:prostasin n=1 Tax=Drosophila teissieri TaxID=7243 RepID=UPI001CBA3EF9|nr:prostasin [Drosophila teissieri]